jgi:hypothetical protein
MLVSLDEVKKVLEGFEKEKSPGSDGWTVEFFLECFDVMGEDLLPMVEETMTTRKVSDALNATFITLIPKRDNPETIQDYRHITLCSLVYKLITRIIANRIKPSMYKFNSKQQFGFLNDRKITEVIGIAQKRLHSIKVR